jgi:surface protein
MRFLNFLKLVLIATTITLSSCSKEDDEESTQNIALPSVETRFIKVNGVFIYCGGDVTNRGTGGNPFKGLVWSFKSNPNHYENEIYHTFAGTGLYELIIRNLPADTIVYFRAFASNEAGKVYGEEMSVRTGQANPKNAYFNSRGCLVCKNYKAGEYFKINDEEYLAVDNGSITLESNLQNAQSLCTSKVTNMKALFNYHTWFDQDISKWDVSSVTNMARMFQNAKSFNHDIGNWDVSNVTDMEKMFFLAMSFNKNINDWDVSKVTKMNSMFDGAISFNQKIGNWDVSGVSEMIAMFSGAKSFNQDIGSWDLSNTLNIAYMFWRAKSFNQDIGDWDVSSIGFENSMRGAFKNAKSFNQDLSNWCVDKIQKEPEDFSYGSAMTSAHQPAWGTCPP